MLCIYKRYICGYGHSGYTHSHPRLANPRSGQSCVGRPPEQAQAPMVAGETFPDTPGCCDEDKKRLCADVVGASMPQPVPPVNVFAPKRCNCYSSMAGRSPGMDTLTHVCGRTWRSCRAVAPKGLSVHSHMLSEAGNRQLHSLSSSSPFWECSLKDEKLETSAQGFHGRIH